MLEKNDFSQIVCRELGINAPEPDMTEWTEMLERIKNRRHTVTIGLVGKYVRLHDDIFPLRKRSVMRDTNAHPA